MFVTFFNLTVSVHILLAKKKTAVCVGTTGAPADQIRYCKIGSDGIPSQYQANIACIDTFAF